VVTHPGPGLRAPAGRQYVRVDVDRVLELVANMAEREGQWSEKSRVRTEILRQIGEKPVGAIEIATSSRAGRIEMQVHQPGNILGLEYRLFRGFLAHAREFEEMEKTEHRYRDVTADLDEALTRYGQDHDGVFPENAEGLVEAGYLDRFPDLTPTPLGEYVDGGYTYVPLRDEAGTVAGYFLFVYGGGEGSGFDVFTPENLAHPEAFRMDSDGTKDGVANFCYDGTAIDQVNAWRKD
jgi:hypothetical protein